MLEYLEHKSVASELTKELDEAVEEARRNEKWRLEYMKERVIFMEAREDGRRDGLEEGREEGRREALEKAERSMAEMLVKAVDSAMENFHVDLSGACRGLGYKLDEYEKAKKLISGRKEQE